MILSVIFMLDQIQNNVLKFTVSREIHGTS